MALRAVGVALRAAVGVNGQHLLTPTLAPALSAWREPRRHYAMRLELTEHGIIWKRPEYIPSWKPEKSGDLEAQKLPDRSRPPMSVMPAKDKLDEVDDITRQLLSLKFSSYHKRLKVARYDMMRDIQRHQYDNGSMEVMIAMLTVRIRSFQHRQFTIKKKNTRERVILQETIDRRKKLLKHLRRMDYKRFEWLIEKLNILYRPPPKYYRWVTRKDSLRKLVKMHGQELRQKRLEAYREQLEKQKEPFLQEKAETLYWIAETEKSLGLPVSVESDPPPSPSKTASVSA